MHMPCAERPAIVPATGPEQQTLEGLPATNRLPHDSLRTYERMPLGVAGCLCVGLFRRETDRQAPVSSVNVSLAVVPSTSLVYQPDNLSALLEICLYLYWVDTPASSDNELPKGLHPTPNKLESAFLGHRTTHLT